MAEVTVEHDGPVYIVSINRSSKRNAVDHETAQQLVSAFRRFDEDSRFSVGVLCGSGGTFCSGADLKAILQVCMMLYVGSELDVW